MNPNQATIQSLMQQAQQAQKSLDQVYKNRGLTFDAATGTAKQIEPIKVDTTMSADEIGTVQPFNLPQVAQQTGSDSLIGSIEAQANAYADSIIPQDTTSAQNVAEVQKTLLDKILGREGKASKTAEAYTSEVDPAKKEVDAINAEIEQKTLAYRRQIEEREKNLEGSFGGAVTQDVNDIKRKASSELADLSVIQNAKLNKYSTAKEIADRKVDAELEQEKNEIEGLKAWYDIYGKEFDKQEDRRFNLMINERDRLIKEEEVNKKSVNDIVLTALSNGMPSSLAQQAMKATSTEQAIGLVGSYMQDPKQALELIKLKNEIAAQVPLSGEYASVINGATALVPSTMKDGVRANIGNAIANNDFTTAYAEIANAVENGLTGEVKTKFANARNDQMILSGFRKAIQDYSDAGGDMGLLKGSEESIKRKLGIDSGKASVLATALWREFQTYRSNMTGAAFSAAESRDYASVNPTLGKSLDLNLSVIDGALLQLDNRVSGTINARIPSAKDIYDKKKAQTVDVKSKVIEAGKNSPQLQSQILQVMGENPFLTFQDIATIFNIQ